jgi:SEFIR domain
VSWAHLPLTRDAKEADRWQVDVFTFAHQLCRLGIDTDVDLFHMHDDDVDWSVYGPQAISRADYVLMVASRAYKERWESSGDMTQGAGAAREANVLKAEFDRDRASFLKRVKLILFPGVDVAEAPTELQASIQRFPLANFHQDGLSDLLRTLTGHREWVKPEIGQLPPLPPRDIAGITVGYGPDDKQASKSVESRRSLGTGRRDAR